MEKLALIVCTKDRPDDLTRLFESMVRQSVLPHEVIVVDGGENRVELIANQYSKLLPIKYYTLRPPSLTRQRNFGIQKLDPVSSLVGFIDDDLEFEKGAFNSMIQFFEKSGTGVGGASFNIMNYNETRVPLLKSFFLLDSKIRGRLLRSGVGATYFPALNTMEVQWLCGGATVWRSQVVREQVFDEFFRHLGWNEDIDFSFRASQRHHLFVVHDAQVLHHESQVSRIDNFKFGQIQSIHRLYVVKKYKKVFSLGACYWACFGQMAINFLKSFSTLNFGLLLRAAGNAVGIVKSTLGLMYIVKEK